MVPLLLLTTPTRPAAHAGRHGGGAGRSLTRLGADVSSARAPIIPIVLAEMSASLSSSPPVATGPAPAPKSASAPPPPPPPPPPSSPPPAPPPPLHARTGEASWYDTTPGGCASPTLAFGTVVTVTDVATGGSVRCTVDDRQSASTGRVLDMSETTFSRLSSLSAGVIEVLLSW
jgi:hypothetical protein